MRLKENIRTFDFTPSSIEIEVKKLTFIKELPNLLGSPHKVSFYQLMWVTEGSAELKIDFRKIRVGVNELLLISPGQVCEFDITSDYSGKMILFTDSFFTVTEVDADFLYSSQILSLSNLNQVVSVCPLLADNLIALLEEELKTSADKFQATIAQSLLRVILFEAERNLSSAYPPSSNKYNLAQSFHNAVEKHFRENKRLEYYTSLLAVSERVLSKEVKLLTGETPKVYLDKRVVLEAKRLLAYSKLSAKEIGFLLGFEEPGNFNNFFRKHTGLTPANFRVSIK